MRDVERIFFQMANLSAVGSPLRSARGTLNCSSRGNFGRGKADALSRWEQVTSAPGKRTLVPKMATAPVPRA